MRKSDKRVDLKDRLRKKALEKKPTASELSRRGLTVEQVETLFGQPVSKPLRRINQKGGLKRARDKRPKQVIVKQTLEPYVRPSYLEVATPPWFGTEEKVDVSIIVPLYRSLECMVKQVQSWVFDDDGLTKEIVYVDDGCPNKTHTQIIHEWEKKNRHSSLPCKVGKIVVNNSNGGFAFACNTGAMVAQGDYLIFLNADTEVTPNWIKPIIDLLKKEHIGIVGNMQIRKDGSIDSAGSHWSWGSNSFQHIGRNIYRGRGVDKPIKLSEAPSDLLVPSEKDMVTGCCFGIRKNLFMDLEGFNEEYRIGYWEDADLCMRVKAEGYKIFYQPDSRIIHKVGHSNAGGHPAVQQNKALFKKKWIDTCRIDKLIDNPRKDRLYKGIRQSINGKVIGCVIACNEEEFLEATVDSAAPMVHEWIFVIGGNNFAWKSGMCDRNGYPTDNTLAIAYKLAKKYGGKVIEPPGRPWKDKVEMRNAYVEHLNPGNWMFMLDGDEVYKENQLWRISELMRKYECMIFQFWIFWNNVDTIGTGTWGNYPQERIVHWKPGFRYMNGNHLHVSCSDGQLVRSTYPTFHGPEKMFYHYSWVRPIEKIHQKLEYYKHQTGSTQAASYVDDVFLKWREDPMSVQGKTHPMQGGGAAPFPGVHPQEVKELIRQNKLDF